MIFVFSGTGNSYVVARRMADELELPLLDITKQVRNKRWLFDAAGEDVGFVFPVYFWGLPAYVREFVENVQVRNPGRVWCVATCAGESGAACRMLADKLKGRLDVDACYDILMPENAVFYESAPEKDEAERILADADDALTSIISSVKDGESGDFTRYGCEDGVDEMYAQYDLARHTEAFSIGSDCIECRICEEVCPSKAIRIYHRKPVWDEEMCNLCMGCLNMCPKKTIQFGEETVGRNRYYHKEFHKKVLGIPLRF